ncbi:hypothetical protein K450DRAFT_244741 [Umbelopsis ramanniana AG]|uniref:Dienelactone hydrolase domain-containing protein n=1 Tax=Umbelopsis ramanniana AG TaxID=1314678 RepID=A0AAD5E9G1_UMBRA|nr:uncharacterized protein K450DRAFT_244741 [Umbelopsis ramanniana AG]KAI8578831.1 hypothetical protein K450DRAFT_244741 [Umbelopsis ramanniana AG]
MSTAKACCQIPPVVSNYQPVGTVDNLGDLPVYTVGNKDSKKAIIVIMDIFGFHVNTKQFCDVLANHCGYRVVLPDWFRGKPATHDMLGDMSKLTAWLQQVGTIDIIKPQVDRVKEHLVADGVVKTGLVGFCWGAKIAIQLSAQESYYSAASLIHPSFFVVDDAKVAQAPLLVIPSKDEADLTEFMEILKQKPFGDKCKHVRFDDVHHGFAAARGNWEEGTADKKRATEAIQLTADFFAENIQV